MTAPCHIKCLALIFIGLFRPPFYFIHLIYPNNYRISPNDFLYLSQNLIFLSIRVVGVFIYHIILILILKLNKKFSFFNSFSIFFLIFAYLVLINWNYWSRSLNYFFYFLSNSIVNSTNSRSNINQNTSDSKYSSYGIALFWRISNFNRV